MPASGPGSRTSVSHRRATCKTMRLPWRSERIDMVFRRGSCCLLFATCVIAAWGIPCVYGEPIEFAQLREEARVRKFARAASLCAIGPSPIAMVVSETSARHMNREEPGSGAQRADKLDLSPWHIEDGTKMASLQENSSEYAACIYVLVAAHHLSWTSIAHSTRKDVTFAHLF